jgi:uncharacterized membrane protein YeiH
MMENVKSIGGGSPREVMVDSLEWVDNCQCVMILAIAKDGTQVIRSSAMSHYEKCFLVTFMNAWATSWFRMVSTL